MRANKYVLSRRLKQGWEEGEMGRGGSGRGEKVGKGEGRLDEYLSRAPSS